MRTFLHEGSAAASAARPCAVPPACRQIFVNDDPSTYKESGVNARNDWSLIYAGGTRPQPVRFGSDADISPVFLRIMAE